MKILIDGNTLSKGAGVGNYLKNILIYLNNDITVFGKKKNYNSETIKYKKNIFHNVFTRLLYEHIIFQIIAYWENFDVIFSPKSYASILKLKPQLVMFHDIIPMNKNSGEKWYVRLYWILQFYSASRFADGIIFSNHYVYKQVLNKYKFIKNKRIKIIPYGYNNYKKHKNRNEKYILIPSTIKKRKNIELAVRIAETIKKQYNDKEIIVTGRIDDKYLYEKLKQNNNINLLGYISDKKMENYFNDAFVIIYLSSKEGFSLPIAESIFLEKKVIASDIKIHKHLYKDYPIYYNFVKTFNENMEYVLYEIKNKKRKYNEKIQTWKETAKSTEKFFSEICKKS